ncbi:MAG: hypothetical protein H7A24_13145 [Leptospiraceae bacterium]|nr:hypothetical protein [Leptospiraceae bacterium]MCP5512823.1 hypothetical protein [Leptospiraceae bacterium]
MPVYEYHCTRCNKRMEAYQHSSEALSTCDQIDPNCTEKGELEKLFSTFAMKGDSSSADRFLSSRESGGHSHSSGCGCFGSASCPADSVRSKYGLD